MRILWYTLIFVSLLSGCLNSNDEAADGRNDVADSPDSDAVGPDDPTPGAASNHSSEAGPVVHRASGDHPAAAGACHEETGATMAGVFTIIGPTPIPANTSVAIVEAQWEGGATIACIAAVSPSESYYFYCDHECLLEPTMRGEIPDPQEGDWEIHLNFQGPVALVNFDVAVSSFFDDPPADYSALDS